MSLKFQILEIRLTREGGYLRFFAAKTEIPAFAGMTGFNKLVEAISGAPS